ncbi:MAG: RNase adapter RapZ [Deltaproteobacteria bacterium]|nr:MAG: RNase adapter RapZ [Deltaproteobacteria bacterium]
MTPPENRKERERNPQVIIVTGISGSGKSTVLKVLEDTGFYCIDNLPVIVIPRIVEILTEDPIRKERLAFVIDVRGKEFLDQFPRVMDELEGMGVEKKVIYTDCSDEVLLRRFKETRRKHPLSETGNPLEGIGVERRLLEVVRDSVDLFIDTSEMNVHQLRDYILKELPGGGAGKIHVTFISFGFKYGIPAESDLVFDVRFLPNPHFVPSLRSLTGLDEGVRDFVLREEVTEEFIGKVTDLLSFLLPQFVREGKSYLTVSVGCTGGRHRSVAVAEELSRRVKGQVAGVNIEVRHRDHTKS